VLGIRHLLEPATGS